MANLNDSFDVPYQSEISDNKRFLTTPWTWFFRSTWERLYSLGIERQFTLVNNQSAPADVTGLRFDKRGVAQATVTYLVQRVTTGGSAAELIESGIFTCAYRPTSESWDISAVNEHSPDDAGITFTITADGQVQYTTTNETGTPLISNLFWRASTFGGKNQLYSAVGAR